MRSNADQIAFEKLAKSMGLEDIDHWDLAILVLNACVRIDRLTEENKNFLNNTFTCPDCGYEASGKEIQTKIYEDILNENNNKS